MNRKRSVSSVYKSAKHTTSKIKSNLTEVINCKDRNAIRPVLIKKYKSTRKYLYKLSDDNVIETVCITRRTGITACVSTQVGCAVRCRFCESGVNGLVRNLTASEIVQQVQMLNEKVNRIVFMGMGEPLHNYHEVIQAIHILRDRNGLNFPTDGITISTVGPVKKLIQLREEHIKCQLVLSLHATTQDVRDFLMPGMKSDSIYNTINAALSHGKRHNRRITIAYLLLPNVNNKISDKKNLIKWFANRDVLINLMSLNNTYSNTFVRAGQKAMSNFKRDLEIAGLKVTIRHTTGEKINAACGQLAGSIAKRPQINKCRKSRSF